MVLSLANEQLKYPDYKVMVSSLSAELNYDVATLYTTDTENRHAFVKRMERFDSFANLTESIMKALGQGMWGAETKKKRRNRLYSVPWDPNPQCS